jgi:ABC-type multidrug transport system ATPase subunit/pSer/pThr/pTyr-binding forkhead associated (FHA) protein
VAEPTYPALFDLAGKTTHPLRGRASFLVGRSETADLTVLDVTCSRQQFRIVRADGRYHVEPLSQTSPTYHNGQPISQRTPLAHEDRLDAGNGHFVYLARAPEGKTKPSILAAATVRGSPARPTGQATDPPLMETVMAGSGAAQVPEPPAEGLRPIALSGKMLIGRDAGRVQIPLAHPHVSRVHAHITLHDGRAVLVDLDSANGTFVNGARVRKPATLRPGDLIDIGPYALQFTGQTLVPRTRSDNVELVARKVGRTVTNRETGKPLALLDDITLVIRPREFVCLLGPSGSGKSTLLSALSGRAAPDAGGVLVNGQDLHAHFDALKQDIAVVPQKDILHESLSVGAALWYTARLRLPPDLSGTEVRACIDETLETVGLQQRRGTLIRHLSGGQVKRASLANEIMGKPSLLFLDEVTSGLDEQTDRDMMNLFRSVADAGKTVVCITHSLANVERTCHLVVILTPGGRLAFVGKPAEALEYFGIQRLGDVYERLAEQPAEHWQQAFRAHPLYQQYVTSRLPQETEVLPVPARAPARPGERRRLFFRQTALLTQRYFAIWRGDYLALLAMAGQSLLVAVLLAILFGNLAVKDGADPAEKAKLLGRSLNLLFLLAVTSFWFGCNNAAKEIVKERAIYTRERDFNVGVGSYYCSKLLLLVFFSAVQALLLAGLAQLWCHPPGALLGKCVLLTALAGAGAALGLAISAASPTEEMAITLIPVAVVPQIILAGVIAPVEGLSKVLAQTLITAYWGNRGLLALLNEDDAKLVGLKQGSYFGSTVVVLAHAALFVIVALGALYWQGRGARTVGNLLRRAKGQA